MAMRKEPFSIEADGFFGAYYPCPSGGDCAFVLMLGDDVDDLLARAGAKWMHAQGCNVLCMAPGPKDYGHRNYPLERFGLALDALRQRGNVRFGIAGASTTGMLSLIAASYYPDFTLTVALSPSDFVMQGFIRDGLDGAEERPADDESTVSWRGEPLPFLPYAYKHPEYWTRLKQEAKDTRGMAAARAMFDESERLHPLREDQLIKVERICGHVVFVGAEDDTLWDTCRYIRRMAARLERMPHGCTYELLTFEHGTHFVFPESMLKCVLPVGGGLFVRAAFKAARDFPRECRATRLEIDRRLTRAIENWQAGGLPPSAI